MLSSSVKSSTTRPQLHASVCCSLLLVGLGLIGGTESAVGHPASRPSRNTRDSAPTTSPATTQGSTDRRITNLVPEEQFSKLVTPVARKYGVSVPAKSFAELRAIRMTPDGQMHHESARDEGSEMTVTVPSNYGNGEKTFGLMVWMSPGGEGTIPEAWVNALAKREMMIACPRDIGNERHVVLRLVIAIQAVKACENLYQIDPDRIYIAGISGGGRVSSHAAVFFPDVFDGAFCMAGANFYHDTPAEPGKVYPGFWPHPEAALIARGKLNTRFVLLTGMKDFNQPSTKAAFNAFQKDGWLYPTYLEVPDMAHGAPPTDWFEKGLDALDEPLTAMSSLRYAEAVEFERKKKPGDACLAYESAGRHGGDQPFTVTATTRGAQLRTQYLHEIGEIRQMIASKKYEPANLAIRVLKDRYGAMATGDVERLFETVRDTRQGRTPSGGITGDQR